MRIRLVAVTDMHYPMVGLEVGEMEVDTSSSKKRTYKTLPNLDWRSLW